MKISRQVLLVVLVLLVAAGGWFAFGRGGFGGGSAATTSGGPPAASAQNGGAPPGRPGGAPGAPGGGGFNRAVLVVTAKVTTANDGIDVEAVGTVNSARSVTIYPQVTGIVAELSFKPGAAVTAGQTLVHLIDDDKKVAVEQAQVALDSANQALARVQQLAKSNNATTVAVSDAQTAVRKAEIDLKAARIELAKYTITAPFAGIAGLTDISVGDLVTTQKPITTLDDMATVTVAFAVPERASGLVADGQAVAATTPALAGKTFAGKITAVDSRADPVARTLNVEATLPNDANVLKPGMAMNVSMTFPGVERTVVPSLAVQWDKQGPYVWKIADKTAHRASVSIVGRRSGEVLVVSDNLKTADEVVVEGLQRLREGSTVTIAGAPPTGSS